MTEKKLCGFDINGWRDFVARNWKSVPGEEENIGPVDIVPSGPLSSVVKVGEGDRTRWIGGPQADGAPHGLGGGWGDIGFQDRRVFVRKLLEVQDNDVGRLASCFAGSARGGAYNVLSIDEGADGSEAVQEHLLAALTAGKYRNGSLVWRPVLAALYAIEQGLVGEGQTIGVVGQDRYGLAIQRLRIRSARGMLAPERREAATHISCEAGYENLVLKARTAAIGGDGFTPRTAHRAIARSVGRAALGMVCEPEILRAQNGDWDVLDLNCYDSSKFVNVPQDNINLNGCDLVLLETLTEGSVRDRLTSEIRTRSHSTVSCLPANAVARGALSAAQRAGSGAPIFFDFLPRMSTVVYSADGAKNFDLIRPDETLEAGRTYRSPEPASLAIPAGQQNISVYLRKEAAPPPRKATVDIGASLAEPADVSLWVEQKPAAGRARIQLEAPGLGRHFIIDWEEAQEDGRSWEQIIQSLEPRASIPNRLILPCGMHAWEDSERSEGMLSLLEREPHRSKTDWDTLAAKLSQRPFGQYCISSDGELPTEVGSEDRRRLDELTDKALDITRRRLRGETGPGTEDNAALKFLTWQFRRCPPEVATWLMDCIETTDHHHPFVRHQASWVLVYQGLGRILQDEEAERRAMGILLSSDIEAWKWNRQSAGMAFLLSRSDTAPLHLERRDVEKLAERTIADFRRNIGAEYTMFNYAPFLLAGLLRWRLKQPSALLSGVDPLAGAFLRVIEDAETDLVGRRTPNANLQRRRAKFLPILRDLKAELLGEGTNPDLLLDIYGAGGS
ncbi:hypothetical protein [Roseovarius indicus]|uniref:hypothetical protein n=1 Tax=Roseovarius indicus TaxID=540747 RepID=UPI0032EAF75C